MRHDRHAGFADARPRPRLDAPGEHGGPPGPPGGRPGPPGGGPGPPGGGPGPPGGRA
ncbi:MAG: hypothetical protein GJU76_12135, partial [Gallionella sp.]|nr:hypothetical protein [Gallionella sp.]